MAEQPHFTDILASGSFGRFQIFERLATAGQAAVYKALDRNTSAFCTLTVIGIGPAAALGSRDEILRRAQQVLALEHPGIVPYQAAGIEGGYLFLQGPLVELRTLADRLAERPLGIEEAARCLKGITEALAYAHERGVPNLALRPEFIYLDEIGDVRVAYLGLGYLAGSLQGSGTAAQDRAVPISDAGLARAVLVDVYDLGILLFRMLTGYTTSNTSRPAAEIVRLYNERMALRQAGYRQLPEGVQAVILKAVAAEASRFESVGEMYAAFQAAAAPILDAHLRLRNPQTRPLKVPVVARNTVRKRVNRRRIIGWVLIALSLTAGGFTLAYSGRFDLPGLLAARGLRSPERVELTAMVGTIEALSTRVHITGPAPSSTSAETVAATSPVAADIPATSTMQLSITASGTVTPPASWTGTPSPGIPATQLPPGATQPPPTTGASPAPTKPLPTNTTQAPSSTTPPQSTAPPTQTLPAPTNTSPPPTATSQPPTSTTAPPTNTPILPLPTITLPPLLP